MVVVAIMLIIGGVIFLWIESYKAQIDTTNDACSNKGIYQITTKQALIVGIAQAFALIPGTSRSGASIVGGLLAGLDRETATTFSFYLAIPALGGATLITLLTSLDELESQQLGFLILGGLVAGWSGWLIIAWLLRYVAHHNFIIFGYYRILVGFALLVLVVLGLM
jgi:undecaprenyl-diphosphatase